MKPGNFALIIEIHDGHTTPLGVVDSVTTARRMVRNAVSTRREELSHKLPSPVFEVYRFTNHKPSYVWQYACVPGMNYRYAWVWTKTYTRLWKKPIFKWKQLVRAGKK